MASETLSHNYLKKAKDFSSNADFNSSSKSNKKKSKFFAKNLSSHDNLSSNKAKFNTLNNIQEDNEDEKEESSSSSDYMGFSEPEDYDMDFEKVGSIREDDYMVTYAKELEGCERIDYNVLDLARLIDRDKVLPVLSIKFINDLDLMRIVNQNKLNKFLEKA